MTKIDRKIIWGFPVLIVLIILAYSNTFTVPFIFDDYGNIIGNATIHQLWPPLYFFNMSAETGLVGRPLISLSLAINYAISGNNVWSYHVLNLIIHILATLTFLEVVRLTIIYTEKGIPYSKNAFSVAFSCALLWGLHPLQTEAVTYVIQRCESLMAFFFILTFYSAIHGWYETNSRLWHLAAILFFLLALSSKEVAAICPAILLLYEWVFKGYTPLRAVKQSPLLYTGLAFGLTIAIFTAINENTLISRTSKFIYAPSSYWITQCQIIFHYLRLVVWPSGLTFDYGWTVASIEEVWPSVMGILILIGLSAWAVLNRYTSGFLGACFFLILLPTSLIPLSDLIFEHRMYLPLTAIIILIVFSAVGSYEWMRRKPNTLLRSKLIPNLKVFIATIIGVGIILGVLTYQRNYDYRTELAIWLDTIKKSPHNFRAYHNAGVSLRKTGHLDEALTFLRAALALNAHSSDTQFQIGLVLLLMNKPSDAIPFLQEGLRKMPYNTDVLNALGAALAQTGRFKEAVFNFSEALKIKPADMIIQRNLIKARAAYNKSISEHYKK